MAISSREFVYQLRTAVLFSLNFTWAHPMISLLLCTSVFSCILFPKVFKWLIFSAPLIVSTILFLAAILRVGPQPTEPVSKNKEEEPSLECHQNDCGRAEIEIKRLAVVRRAEEARIVDFAEQTLGEGAEIDDNVDEAKKFAKGVEIMESAKEEEDITEHAQKEHREEEQEKTAKNDMETSHGRPRAFVVEETGEESFLVEQPNSWSASGSDEENGGKVSPQNFFALPLHSSWKRFDSSSDSGSEGSVGELGPLFDGIDPAVFEEEPNAGGEHASMDFRFSWIKDEGDEPLFELVHRDGLDSDSLSEDENLIEIAVSEELVMERQGLEMQEKNLICLNNSNEEILGDQGCVQKQILISEKRTAFPEEDNLIEIDLSVDPFVVTAHEDINSSKVDNSTVLSKERPIESLPLKSSTDLLNQPIHEGSSVLADQAEPSEDDQKSMILEEKPTEEIESRTEEDHADNLTCKNEQNQDGSHEQTTKTVELIDMGSPPVAAMLNTEEDEHSKTEKTEIPSDASITGIQKCNTTSV